MRSRKRGRDRDRGGGVKAFIDLWRIQFVAAASQLLQMTAANFGAFDRLKFTISRSVTFDTLGATQTLFRQGLTSGNFSSILYLNSANQIAWSGSSNGTTFDSSLTTTATYTTGTKIWVALYYDAANVVPGDRVRLYVNRVRVTAFDTETYPVIISTPIYDSAHDIEMGGATGKTQFLNGKQNECAFVSGGSPPATAFSDSANNAKDLTWIPGLWSWLTFEVDTVTDKVLATAWTAVNAPTRVSNP